MKIAVVGGGSAGLVSAWLLGVGHRVQLFERAPMLGGNVRTLGRNVPCDGLGDGVVLDAGVIEFGQEAFPRFHALMDELGVALHEPPGTTALIIDGGPRLASPGNIAQARPPWPERLRLYARLLPVGLERRRFFAKAAGARPEELSARSLGDYLEGGLFARWARLLAQYAWSIPYDRIDALPAALAVPTLASFMRPTRWSAVTGGVYRYMERLLADDRFEAHCSVRIRSIERQRPGGVRLNLESGEALGFDALVFAAPPDQVLALLADADATEQRWFGGWHANHAETLVHYDTGLYERRGLRYMSEFDVFETAAGERGYNAYLNRLSQVPADLGRHYGLAYGIEGEIDPARIVHRQPHHTPLYTVEALRHREELRAANGYRGIWYAGAWLGDGLHEGAISSAYAVARGIGV